ncbi:MAG: hypothetical protein HY885_01105 [Deltaproteobacteria bacterium]|nr:hypothetical protein [Deltaproteobacteria bacterium]
MNRTSNAIEDKLTELSGEVKLLGGKIDTLTSRMERLEKNPPLKAHCQPASPVPFPKQVMPANEILAGVDKSTFLSKLATICFILVFALVLRTLTDGGILAHKTGSFIGIAYAASLIAVGWKLLKQQSGIASVFPVCGALLIYSVVLETHARFEPFTSATAYAILFLTLITLAALGKRFSHSVLIGVGLLGAATAALIIDFPRPISHQVAIFLLAANILAFYLSDLPLCRGIQIALYSLTLLFWILWAHKINFNLTKGWELPAGYSLFWFIPLTALFGLTFTGLSYYRAFHRGRELGITDSILPTITVSWTYATCWAVALPWLRQSRVIGVAGVAFAALLYGGAWAIFRYSRDGGTGICAFTFAASTLLLLASPAAAGDILFALPFLSTVALALLMSSHACEVGGIRLSSYLLQVLACILAVFCGVFAPGSPTGEFMGFLAAASMALLSGFHYFLSRRHPISCSSGFFPRLDPADRTAVALLIAALVNGYYMALFIAYHLLVLFSDGLENGLIGSQSVLINTGAIGLMILGLKGKKREILYTATGVAVIGACKVFGFDLFKAKGIPLVVSVFSFGAVAAVGSVVLRRIPRMQKT